MAPLDSTVRKLPEPAAPQYRSAPQNIEAEQALLGAILVNNEAFYRVSDFLESRHFFEPIHQQVYEITSNLIRAGLGLALALPRMGRVGFAVPDSHTATNAVENFPAVA